MAFDGISCGGYHLIFISDQQAGCHPCEPGRYNPVVGADSSGACLLCAAGEESYEGATTCTPCLPGSVATRQLSSTAPSSWAVMDTFVDVGYASLPCSCSGLLSFQVACGARNASVTVELRATTAAAVQLELDLGGVPVSWGLAASTSWQNFTSPSLLVGSEQVLKLRASTEGLQIRWRNDFMAL